MYKKYHFEKKNENLIADVFKFANILRIYAKEKFHQINHPVVLHVTMLPISMAFPFLKYICMY